MTNLLTKREKARILKRFEAAKVALGKVRDELRDIGSEIQQFGDDAAEGLEDLERATEALSRLL